MQVKIIFYRMTRGEGYYRVYKEVKEFERDFIRQYRDDFFFHVEEEEQENWISEKIQEYLDEWCSMGYLSYKEKMNIISKYGLGEALKLIKDMGMNIHDTEYYPEDTLAYAIIKEECRITPDDLKKEESDDE